jgi:hypothetical protein
MKYRLIAVLFFYSISALKLDAQILNVDRENTDSMQKSWYFLFNGSYTKDKQVRDIVDFSYYNEFVYQLKSNYGIMAMLKFDGTTSGQNIIQNEGYVQLRVRDLDRRLFSFSPFLQYQWNGAWGMIHRRLIGTNIRAKLFDTHGEDGYIGLGLFYQDELWDKESKFIDNEFRDKQFRLNSYFKTAVKISSNLDFVTQIYFQAPLKIRASKDYRLYNYAELNFSINDYLSLGLYSDLFYNALPRGDVDETLYGWGGTFKIVL